MKTLIAAGLGILTLAASFAPAAQAAGQFSFDMKRSSTVTACAPSATAHITIKSLGFAEQMTVVVSGLPSTAMDLFVIQVPAAPFGVGWYVGDLQTNAAGTVTRTFVGRFNDETFAVAPGSASAPHPHATDASVNPPFKPIHTFHVGIWFNSPADAAKNHCPTTVTPFNGEHNAGIQVLNTANFPLANGPLRNVD